MAEHRRMHVDVTDEQVKKLKLGEGVTITAKGKVVELRDGEMLEIPTEGGERKRPKRKRLPPTVVIDVSSTKVSSGGNAFAKLAEDEEEAE